MVTIMQLTNVICLFTGKSPQHQPGSPGHGAQLKLTRQTSASSVGSTSSTELYNGECKFVDVITEMNICVCVHMYIYIQVQLDYPKCPNNFPLIE